MINQPAPWSMLLSTQSLLCGLVTLVCRGRICLRSSAGRNRNRRRRSQAVFRPARCGARSGCGVADPRPSCSPAMSARRRRSGDTPAAGVTPSPPSPVGHSSRYGVTIISSLRPCARPSDLASGQAVQHGLRPGCAWPPARSKPEASSSIYTTDITSHWLGGHGRA